MSILKDNVDLMCEKQLDCYDERNENRQCSGTHEPLQEPHARIILIRKLKSISFYTLNPYRSIQTLSQYYVRLKEHL